MGPALWVPEQAHDDVAVAEVEDGLRPVPREASKLEEEGDLDAVPAVCVPLLCGGEVCLEDHRESLNVYDRLLALLPREVVLLCYLPEDLDVTL